MNKFQIIEAEFNSNNNKKISKDNKINNNKINNNKINRVFLLKRSYFFRVYDYFQIVRLMDAVVVMNTI